MSGLRRKVERRSATLLVFLRQLPRPVPGLLLLTVAAVGVLVPGAGGALALLLVALVLGWLCYLSWPSIPTPGRAVRLAVLALVLAAAAARFT